MNCPGGRGGGFGGQKCEKFLELPRKSIQTVFTPPGGILGCQKIKVREMS